MVCFPPPPPIVWCPGASGCMAAGYTTLRRRAGRRASRRRRGLGSRPAQRNQGQGWTWAQNREKKGKEREKRLREPLPRRDSYYCTVHTPYMHMRQHHSYPSQGRDSPALDDASTSRSCCCCCCYPNIAYQQPATPRHTVIGSRPLNRLERPLPTPGRWWTCLLIPKSKCQPPAAADRDRRGRGSEARRGHAHTLHYLPTTALPTTALPTTDLPTQVYIHTGRHGNLLAMHGMPPPTAARRRGAHSGIATRGYCIAGCTRRAKWRTNCALGQARRCRHP